jgi:hypothetical protein
MVEIRKLTLALEKVDKSSPQYSKLLTIYEKELKGLFKSSFNSFVNMRNYLDNIKDPQFKSIWKQIKDGSDGNWLNEFGALNKHIPAMDQFFGGLKNNFKILESYETFFFKNSTKKLYNTVSNVRGSKNINKATIDKMSNSIYQDLKLTFLTGSKDGFPSMKNPAYKELIATKGMNAARISYLKDLLWNKLKYSLLFSFLAYHRDVLFDEMYYVYCMNKLSERLLTLFYSLGYNC